MKKQGARPAKTSGHRPPASRQKKGETRTGYDAENEATLAMLDEIRGVLSAGPQGTEPGKKKKVKESPFAYMPDYVKDMSKRDAAKKANKLKDYKPKADPNDLLSHYLNQPKQEVEFSKDEMREKAVIAPYIDTLVTVDQKLWMDDYTNAQKRKANYAEEEKKRIKEGRQGKKNNKAMKRKHDVSHPNDGEFKQTPVFSGAD